MIFVAVELSQYIQRTVVLTNICQTSKTLGFASMKKAPSTIRAGGSDEVGSNILPRTDSDSEVSVVRVVVNNRPPTFRVTTSPSFIVVEVSVGCRHDHKLIIVKNKTSESLVIHYNEKAVYLLYCHKYHNWSGKVQHKCYSFLPTDHLFK